MVEQSVGEFQAESPIDDYSCMDLDINSLVARFLQPIDRFRSRNAPNATGPLKQSQLTSENSTQESRAHAFYRMLGLPTIAPDGKLFNPGFNPLREGEENTRQANIASSIPHNMKMLISTRENRARTYQGFFARGMEAASVLSIALGTPKGQRKFSVSDTGIESLSEPNFQIQQIPARKEFITTNYKKKDGSEISVTFDSVQHILAPFMTDPVISSNLDPVSGSSSVVIGAPFLDKKDLEYERGKYAPRPGLEFILRLRLRQQSANPGLQELDFSELVSEISEDRQREIASAISGIGIQEDDLSKILSGIGYVELYTLDDLVRIYKGLISLYVQNVEIIEDVSKQIIWVPLANEGGPEFGTEVSTGFVLPKRFLDWEVERRIWKLDAKSSMAKRQIDIGENNDGTPLEFKDFAISEFQNLANTFDEDLQEANNERAQLEADGSNALRAIEIISGEVSGLGLIDIIAIYMALWSVDVSVLLDLLDDPAAKRLNDIVELKTEATVARAARYGNAKESYEKLARRINSILSYGDRLYQRELGSPSEEEGGDIERD